MRTLGCEDGWYELEVPLRADACLIYKKHSPKIRLIRDYADHVLQSFGETAEQAERGQFTKTDRMRSFLAARRGAPS